MTHRILLAEDNPHDQLLLEEAFNAQNLAVEIDSVRDGDELIGKLRQSRDEIESRYKIIVLDAHLPRRSAEEVLCNFQGDDRLPVPVVIVSSLMTDSLGGRFAELGAAAVLTKPLDMDEFFGLAKTIYALME